MPLASQVSREFHIGSAFDVNPVVWHELLSCGITVRGTPIVELGLVDDPVERRRWTADNLEAYWRPWSSAVRGRGAAAVAGWSKHLSLAWGVLGAPRLHCTIASGRVISKPEAARYGLDTFDAEWHPLLLRALEYWNGTTSPYRRSGADRRAAGAFVEMVCDHARGLPQPD